MLWMFLFLYMINGQPMLEKAVYTTQEECFTKGQEKITEILKNPRVDGGIYAGCLPTEGKAIGS